jgi:hypothetical protein
MYQPDINYWAVLVAGIAPMILGAIWYSPMLFGNTWAKLAGVSQESAKKGAAKAYILMFILALVLAYIMAHFVDFAIQVYPERALWSVGLTTGFFAWLGFVVTTKGAQFLFAQKSWKYYLIDIGYHFVEFLAVGLILAIWRA